MQVVRSGTLIVLHRGLEGKWDRVLQSTVPEAMLLSDCFFPPPMLR
jgi:hypothetical protein